MQEVPAFIFYKGNYEIIKDFTDKDKGRLFEALFKYAIFKEEPKTFPKALLICFKIFKLEIDRNEQKYKSRVAYMQEYNRKRQQEKQKPAKTEQKKQHQDEETPKKKATAEKTANKSKLEHNQDKKQFTQEQQNFINHFKDLCPEKSVDCDVNDFP